MKRRAGSAARWDGTLALGAPGEVIVVVRVILVPTWRSGSGNDLCEACGEVWKACKAFEACGEVWKAWMAFEGLWGFLEDLSGLGIDKQTTCLTACYSRI